jgi:hypothetical protein
MPKNTDEPIETQSPSPRPAPRWLNLLIVALGLSGLILLLVFYDQAFPTAAIDLSLSRAEIAQRAQAYLEERGYDTSGYKFALTFGEDSWASYYLQRTLGTGMPAGFVPCRRKSYGSTWLPTARSSPYLTSYSRMTPVLIFPRKRPGSWPWTI